MNEALNIYDENKFMTVSEWKRREFAKGSEPQNRTVRHWIEKRVIVGAMIGRIAYVRCDQRAATRTEVDHAVDDLIEMSK